MSYIDNQDIQKKRAFLEKIATMYYTNEKSQQEIANQYGIGRSSVARFLNEAKEKGIVKIQINTLTDQFRNKELEQRIKERFGIRDCVVLQSDDNMYIEDVVPDYLDKMIPQKGILGVGGGRTIYNLAKKIWMMSKRPELKVMQLTGSLGSIPETSVTKLWVDALGAKGLYISAPLLAEDEECRKILTESFLVGETLEKLNEIDTTVISIGAIDLNTRLRYLNLFEDIDVEDIQQKCIGDVVFHFFNEKGEFCLGEVSERVIGITRKSYLKVPNKIVIAYGEQKAEAIRAAIQGKLLHVLITDSALAKQLLAK